MIRLRIAFWHAAFRLTLPFSARLSWWCIEREADAETDLWVANVRREVSV